MSEPITELSTQPSQVETPLLPPEPRQSRKSLREEFRSFKDNLTQLSMLEQTVHQFFYGDKSKKQPSFDEVVASIEQYAPKTQVVSKEDLANMSELERAAVEKNVYQSVFFDAYRRATMYCMVINEKYNPLNVGPLTSEVSLIRPVQLFKYARQSWHRLCELSKVPHRNMKNALNNFWRNEVGRPKQVSKQGELVQICVNDKFLNKETGSYASRHDFLPDSKEVLANFSQTAFVAAAIKNQLLAMVDERNEDLVFYQQDEVGQTCVPLPRKENYALTIQVGRRIKKIFLPDETLRLPFAEFYDVIKKDLDPEHFRKGYVNYRIDDNLTEAINDAYEQNLLIQNKKVKQAINSPQNMTGADLAIVLESTDLGYTLEDVQNRPEWMTFGPKRQAVLGFFIDGSGHIDHVVGKMWHPAADGATSVQETAAVLAASFRELQKFHLENENTDRDLIQVGAHYRIPYERKQYREIVETAVLNGEMLRNAVNGVNDEPGLFQFYKEKYNVKVSVYSLLEFAKMMTLGMDHSHFLVMQDERYAEKGGLAPSLCVLPKHLQAAIKRSPDSQKTPEVNLHQLEQLMLCFKLMQDDQTQTKQGVGIVRTMAVMSGRLRKTIKMMGNVFNRSVTDMLQQSALSSMVVGAKHSLQRDNVYSMQTEFTTAAASGTYKQVIGVCDSGEDDIFVSRRTSPDNAMPDFDVKYKQNLMDLIAYLWEAQGLLT